MDVMLLLFFYLPIYLLLSFENIYLISNLILGLKEALATIS